MCNHSKSVFNVIKLKAIRDACHVSLESHQEQVQEIHLHWDSLKVVVVTILVINLVSNLVILLVI